MAIKNSKAVPQALVLSKLQEADDMNVMRIDQVDMQRSLEPVKRANDTKQVLNNQKVLKAASVLKSISNTANTDGYSTGSYGNFDDTKKSYDEMTETDKTFAAMDALIAQDPLDDDEELITAQEVLDGANGITHNPEPKGEGGATADDVKQTVLTELQNITGQTPTAETTPATQPDKEEDKEESGVKAFFNKYKAYILVAVVAIIIYLIAKKKD